MQCVRPDGWTTDTTYTVKWTHALRTCELRTTTRTCALLSCLAAMHGTVYILVAGYGEFTTDGCIPDTVNGAKYVRDLYEKVNDTAGEL